MAISIAIDMEPLSNLFGRMIAQIEHFKRVDIGTGLSDFQVEDMDRHRPFTMRSRAKGLASTKIRPHSLYEMEHSVLAKRRVKRFLRTVGTERKLRKRRRLNVLLNIHWSTRPILREEMYSRLEERMVRLLNEKISWAKVKE